MARAIKNFLITFIQSFFSKWLEDFFIAVGVAVVIYTTYQLSVIAGNYLFGVVFILTGIILAKR